MPVTHNNIWEKIVTFENVYEAFRAASKAKRFRGSILHYGQHLEENIIDARYMDDFVIIHPDKEYLKKLYVDIEVFITDRLHLTFNPKTTIFKSGNSTCHPIDFCGYRVWPDYTKPRKRTVKCARKRFKKFAELYQQGSMTLEQIRVSIVSFLGYMKHCDGKRSVESILSQLIFSKGIVPVTT